jgi:hypothetical protein
MHRHDLDLWQSSSAAVGNCITHPFSIAAMGLTLASGLQAIG